MLLLWQALLSLILPVDLADSNHATPRARRAQQRRGAVAPAVTAGAVAVAIASVVVTAVAVVAAVLIFAVALLVVVASIGSDQRRVAHATDDVFHTGALGTKVLVGQPVQFEGGKGEGLRGSVGVEGCRRGWPPEGGGGRWRGQRRPRREAVRRAVPITGGVAAGVLGLDL